MTESSTQHDRFACVGKLSEESLSALDKFRDTVLSNAPAAIKKSESNTISFIPEFIMPDDEQKRERLCSELLNSRKGFPPNTGYKLTPEIVDVPSPRELTGSVQLYFENELFDTRMRQSENIGRYDGRVIRTPNNTVIEIGCVDDEYDSFDRVGNNDPNGVVEWCTNFDSNEYDDDLPDVLRVSDTVIKQV